MQNAAREKTLGANGPLGRPALLTAGPDSRLVREHVMVPKATVMAPQLRPGSATRTLAKVPLHNLLQIFRRCSDCVSNRDINLFHSEQVSGDAGVTGPCVRQAVGLEFASGIETALGVTGAHVMDLPQSRKNA